MITKIFYCIFIISGRQVMFHVFVQKNKLYYNNLKIKPASSLTIVSEIATLTSLNKEKLLQPHQ